MNASLPKRRGYFHKCRVVQFTSVIFVILPWQSIAADVYSHRDVRTFNAFDTVIWASGRACFIHTRDVVLWHG